MQARKPQLSADFLLVLLGDIETEQHLLVSGWTKFAQDPPHNGCLLRCEYLVQWVGWGRSIVVQLAFHLFVPGSPAEIIDRQVAGNIANEPGKLVGLAQISAPDFFQRQPECVL